MNVFEAIRENGITARQAAEHCGMKINRNGMAVCVSLSGVIQEKYMHQKITRNYTN